MLNYRLLPSNLHSADSVLTGYFAAMYFNWPFNTDTVITGYFAALYFNLPFMLNYRLLSLDLHSADSVSTGYFALATLPINMDTVLTGYFAAMYVNWPSIHSEFQANAFRFTYCRFCFNRIHCHNLTGSKAFIHNFPGCA